MTAAAAAAAAAVGRTDTVLDTLILYTINTGLLTSVCSVLAFIFVIILPGNLIYAGISVAGTKLYAISVLAVLNSRRYISDRFMDDVLSFSLPDLAAPPHTGTDRSIVWDAPARRSACATVEVEGGSVGSVEMVMTFARAGDGAGAGAGAGGTAGDGAGQERV
ncbi:hypothetical protein BD414DRAFT_540745 [Trametes punicea]|nr:hypothetical protein BD414DRAFT_540745 [Trametes punicea]